MKKVVRNSIIVVLIFGAAALLKIKLDLVSEREREDFFYQKIEEKLINGYADTYLRDLTNFEWDYVCTQSSYHPREDYGYADFYFDNRLVAKIRTREINLLSNEGRKTYSNFAEYADQKTDKKKYDNNRKKYDKCLDDFHSSYDSEVKFTLVQDDDILNIKFFY